MTKRKKLKKRETPLQKWIRSKEGRKAISEASRRVQEAEKELREARKVDPIKLITPIEDLGRQ